MAIVQYWPRPSAEFEAEMREAGKRAQDRFDARFRPIAEAPRDGTEIMVSDRKSPILSMFAWRTKWCPEIERWTCDFGDKGWLPTAGEPVWWLHDEPVRDIPRVMLSVGPRLQWDLTA